MNSVFLAVAIGTFKQNSHVSFQFFFNQNSNKCISAKTREVFGFLKKAIPSDDGTKDIRWNFAKCKYLQILIAIRLQSCEDFMYNTNR